MRNHIQSFFLLLPLMLLFGAASVFAQGTAFTFQGKLGDAGSPVNGSFDMQFKLFDAADPNSSNQVGTTITLSNPLVQVTNGVFTVQLDFGAGALPGADRFLEIGIRRNNAEPYTLLSPRSQITSSPYAIRSLNATGADGMSTNCVACIQSSHINSIDASKIAGTVTNATLATNVSGVVAIANGGTGSSIKNFTDLTTDQTIAGRKTFVDPISGDGSGLTNLSVPGAFRWQPVAGLTQQAQPNHGYVLSNNAEVTVSLPATPSIGDIVRVSGLGSGGWKIIVNGGQTIVGGGFTLTSGWSAHESVRQWKIVASSSDGRTLVAGVELGQLYTSTDSGNTWIHTNFPDDGNFWTGVASSADGTKLVACGEDIYTSADSGTTWTPRNIPKIWTGVASSADGRKLVAVEYDLQPFGLNQHSYIYTSSDSGATWTPQFVSTGSWQAVASSADGTKLVAAEGFGGSIYTSTNSGKTWTQRIGGHNWTALASSANGRNLVAVTDNDRIYISTDSGISWRPTEAVRLWFAVASSADGSTLIAIGSNVIYTSADSGAHWTPRGLNGGWRDVAISADGTKAVAVADGGRIYTLDPMMASGTTYLQGEQYTSVELQYIGNGQFMPITHEGSIIGVRF